jgi:2-iminobutanoate/2-iminopropanoate deaminase
LAKRTLYPKTVARSSSPISPGVQLGNMVFVSGQVALDEERKVIGRGEVKSQTRFVITRIQQILAEVGLKLDDVVSTTVYIVNIMDFKAMNEVYAEMFGPDFPARATVRADLMAEGALVEISAIAGR